VKIDGSTTISFPDDNRPSGFFISIFDHIAEKANFSASFTYPEDGEYGVLRRHDSQSEWKLSHFSQSLFLQMDLSLGAASWAS